MSDDFKLKTGDVVVRCGRVLKAFKISKDTIFFKPYFSSNTNSGDLTYSLPLKNMAMTKIRKIVSKQKLNCLFESILAKTTKESEVETLDIKVSLENNDLEETMKIVKILWLEKQLASGLLPGGKLTVYKQALDQLTEEVAAVRGLSLEKAKVEIASALKVGN